MKITRDLSYSPGVDQRWYSVDDGRFYWLSFGYVSNTYALYLRDWSPGHSSPISVGPPFRADNWDEAERTAFMLIRDHKQQIVIEALKEL